MRDMHCHILPGVDDGARDLDESLRMLEAAKAAGVTSIVCTPHCRDPYFDYNAMWDAFELLRAHADGFPLSMGFEVNHAKLMDLGLAWVSRLAFDGSDEFLLELSTRAGKLEFQQYERTIFELQGMGYTVIIAHPERYVILQNEPWRAELWTERGAVLQVTRSGIFGAFGRRAAETARVLLERDLAFCVASDGHGTVYRRPILEDVNAWLAEHFGAAYAERMLHENPRRILSGEAGKERIA